jgi:serine/threonine protein kinase
MPLESILGSNYDSKTDAYSFGILLCEMLTNEITFSEYKCN